MQRARAGLPVNDTTESHAPRYHIQRPNQNFREVQSARAGPPVNDTTESLAPRHTQGTRELFSGFNLRCGNAGDLEGDREAN